MTDYRMDKSRPIGSVKSVSLAHYTKMKPDPIAQIDTKVAIDKNEAMPLDDSELDLVEIVVPVMQEVDLGSVLTDIKEIDDVE